MYYLLPIFKFKKYLYLNLYNFLMNKKLLFLLTIEKKRRRNKKKGKLKRTK